ncbi:branched-chain amino acid transport system II carrier protein [uncultured Anaerococcus sp.]|uniref:branched-chain amino acid transport system II carrier protein n=1 Tax=uncultured Anaerococcus sp. TaxID=293428 RepID=UPI00288A1702|nr:branched-chain amino acid transport system II carrier protein [uncultured Anaerococcus sp.]
MRKKLTLSENLLIGSLLFGLFFGAGNLIFPLELGQRSGANITLVTIGFLLSAVSLPILAVVATAASDSESLFDISRAAGRKFAYFFTTLLYLTIGPGFAIPRTATTTYEVVFEGNNSFYNSFGLLIFSLVFFALVLYFSIKKARLIDTIGKFMTPLFLILLSFLLVLTIFRPMGPVGIKPPVSKYLSNPLAVGFVDGYNTLDAPAGLAFAIIIISNIKDLGLTDKKIMALETLKSGVVCLLAMSVIYAGLAFMGGAAANILDEYENGAVILSKISAYYLGNLGHILLSIIVFVACLKTAIGLVSACSEMFEEMFKHRFEYKTYCIIFSAISLLIANLGLKQIITLSLPVLMFIYPISIVLITLSILSILIGKRKFVYQVSLGVTSVFAFLDFLKASPDFISKSDLVIKILDIAKSSLPGFDIGFSWILPAILAFIISFIIDKKRTIN